LTLKAILAVVSVVVPVGAEVIATTGRFPDHRRLATPRRGVNDREW
jgi:hypothetical protein